MFSSKSHTGERVKHQEKTNSFHARNDIGYVVFLVNLYWRIISKTIN